MNNNFETKTEAANPINAKLNNQISGLIGFIAIVLAITLLVTFYPTEANKAKQPETVTMTTEEFRTLADSISEQAYSDCRANIQPKAKPNFKPQLALSTEVEIVSLAIGIYGETRGDSDSAMKTVGWAIINRAIDPRDTDTYQPSVAGVLAAGSGTQFSSMGPYLINLENAVWGRKLDFVPQLAKQNSEEMDAWVRAKDIAAKIVNGELPRLHTATHFLSPRGMKGKPVPSWFVDLKPVSVQGSGLHIFFTDYITTKKGEIIYFNKENPYQPRKHDDI